MTIEKVKEKIYYQGFEQDLYPELDKQIAEGVEDITLVKSMKIDDIAVDYHLHIKNDIENEALYFNKYDLSFKMPDGEEREHTFSTNRMITAKEGYRMLRFGDKVSVHKTLYKENESYNTWLSLATDKPKDEYGNYEYNSFHENYYLKNPFDLRTELKNLVIPIKELEERNNLPRFEKALTKANLIPITMLMDGKEVEGLLGVDPEKGQAVLYNAKFELVESQRQIVDVSTEKEVTSEIEEVKKKPWNNQKVDWKSKNQHKGRGI